MDQISKFNLVHKYEKRALLIAINCVAGLSIFFFGYDQGVMGGVNTSHSYVDIMSFGHWDDATGQAVIDNPTLQGGINAVYYLPGTLFGAFLGGWVGDRYGRIKTIALAALWATIGAAIQCSAQDFKWMMCARVFTGIGTGILNAITPVWATETADGTSFYGDGTSSFIWRFPIAFQIVPLICLFIVIWFMPESPRWLVKAGREQEARYVLRRLRGESGEDGLRAEAEFQDIRNTCALERQTAKPQSYFAMFFGIGSGKLHTGRRVQLVVWLQIMQEWIGIAGITVYGPTIFQLAGVSAKDRLWVSGLNDITYMFSTLICVFTLDRIGRRWTLYWGSIGQGICILLAGGLSRVTADAAPGHAAGPGGAAIFFVFLFTAIFGATWLTVPWLYPAEIFPLEIRAKGNAWGVVGWSIGNGWLVLLCPVMFAALGEKTLYIFGACNAITIPMVWALYPETNQRTLEEMDLVFASDSIWNWEAEKNYKLLVEQNPELVQAARRGHSVVDPETGMRVGSVGGAMSLNVHQAGHGAGKGSGEMEMLGSKDN
ncbi:hypothetical protein MMC18_001514 [Xylographa bjoerkii]|nr:hypothetical protein [Xylographa bjoerkii]